MTWRGRLGWILVVSAVLIVVVTVVTSESLGQGEQRALALGAIGLAKGVILLSLETRKRRP